MLLKRVRATLQQTPELGGLGVSGKVWITLSCDKCSALLGKYGRKDCREWLQMEADSARTWKGQQNSVENTGKHLCRRVEMQLPHCKAMQLSRGEPSGGREGRGFTCQQAQQLDLKRGLLMHTDAPLQKHQRCHANAPFTQSPTSPRRPVPGTCEGANSPAPTLLLSSRIPGTLARGPELHILLNVPKLQP